MKGESKVKRLIRIIRDLETMHLEGDEVVCQRGFAIRTLRDLLGHIAYDEATLAEAAPSAEVMRGVEAFVEAVEADAVARSVPPPNGAA